MVSIPHTRRLPVRGGKEDPCEHPSWRFALAVLGERGYFVVLELFCGWQPVVAWLASLAVQSSVWR